jgi:hypothetical protein
LSFTNVESGKRVPRSSRVYVFRVGTSHLDPPNEDNKDSWLNLYPDQYLVLENTLRPELTNDACPVMPTFAKIIEKLGIKVKTMRWKDVSGFEDGEIYETGMEDAMQIIERLVGSLEDVLEIKKSGVKLVVQREAVKFELKGTTTFEMKRLDRDGHLRGGTLSSTS